MVDFMVDALKAKGVSYRVIGDYHYIVQNGTLIELEKPIWKRAESHQTVLSSLGLTAEEIAILRASVYKAYQENRKKIKETAKPAQLELYNERGCIVYPRVADLMASELNVFKWAGSYWVKYGNVYKPLLPDDLATAALLALKEQGEPRDWGVTSAGRITSFFPAITPVLAEKPPEYLLYTATDVMDLRTGEVVTPAKNYAAIYYVPVRFDPDARCDRVSEMLKEIFTPEQEKAFLSIFGARLGGRQMQYEVLFTGEGGQGKGKIRTLIQALFGNRMTQTPVADFNQRFANHAFQGADIIWNPEMEGTKLNHDRVKEITGGTKLRVEYKFANGITEYEYQALFVTDSNRPPTLGAGQATRRRLQWFPLKYYFVETPTESFHRKADLSLDEKITKPEELSGFLNMLLPYAKYYLTEGRLMHSASKDLDTYNLVSDAWEPFVKNS